MVLRIVINGVALWAASRLLPGIALAEAEPSASRKILTILVVAAIFGLVNALVRPIAKFFGFPFLVLTLGLFIFIINAAMLMLTSAIAGGLNVPFHVDRFWPTAILGALVVSFFSWLLGMFFDHDDHDRRPRQRNPYAGHSSMGMTGSRGPRLDQR